MIIREYYWRNIKYPGRLSISLVFDANTGERIKPVQEVRSRTGAGKDVYDITTPVYILRYRRSNSWRANWEIAYVKPSEGRNFRKVWFKDLRPQLQQRILEECEKEGIILYPWEEDKHESVPES